MIALSRILLALAVFAGTAAVTAPPAAAQSVDTRCYLFFPDFTPITRSAIGLGVQSGAECALSCFAERQVLLNGEVVSTFEERREAPVDDCNTDPVLIFDPTYVRGGSASSELQSALEDLEQEALNGLTGLHQLPSTDISRTAHVYGYGRGALRAWLVGKIFEIASKPVAERTAAEQLIANRYADEIKRMRVAAVEFALSEYDRWEAAPCSYVPPEGFNYSPGPACADGTLIGLFTDVRPPSKDDFLAYGAVEVRRSLLETEAVFTSLETTRFSQFLTGLAIVGGGTLISGGLISAGFASIITTYFFAIFPSAITSTGGLPLAAFTGATAASLSSAALALGVAAIVLLSLFTGILQGYFVFTDAAIPADLQAALAEAQQLPVLSELVQTDEGKQELYNVFLLSTLPDFRAVDGDSGALPPADQDFAVRPQSGGAETVQSSLHYVGWEGDDWETKLAVGWFLPRPEDGSDFGAITLFIEYTGCDGQDWNATRIGNQFLLLKVGDDPGTAALREEFCYRGSDGQNWIARVSGDTTPPEITKQLSGTPGNEGWYVSDVGIDWTVTEDSTLLWTNGCADRNITGDGIFTLICRAESGGGLAGAFVDFKRDATPPLLTGTFSGINAARWSNSSVEVSFECADSSCFFGICSPGVYSGIDFCSPTMVFSSEGADQEAIGTAVDIAGNTTTKSVGTFGIDRTPPQISGTALPLPNAAGWNNQAVGVAFVCDDALSGVETCPTGLVSLSEDGAGQSVDGTAVDRAGNTKTTRVGGINIDRTAPEVTVSAPADGVPTYLLNEVVIAGWSATDALSGIDTVTRTVDSGEAIDTSTIGVHMFEVRARDVAGNVTTVQRTYEVIDNVAAFEFTVETATLSTWRDSPRDNGFVTLRGRLVDPNPDGTFIDRLLEGGFAVQVTDGDGSFDVTVELPDCEERGARGVLCRARVPRPVVISIVPEDRKAENPASYELRVSARKLPDSETGPLVPDTNPIEGPVEVTLRRGAATTSAELTDCTPRGYGTLICDGGR